MVPKRDCLISWCMVDCIHCGNPDCISSLKIWLFGQGKPVEVRQAAGLYLKNNLKSAYKSMVPVYQQYVKSELLPCLGAADRNIRSTVGTIISVVVQLEGVSGWPELLQALLTCLDSNDINHMEGAMDDLSKVCSAS